MYAPVGMIRAFGPHPFGAAVALRRRCLAPTVLGSNPRWAFNPYSLSRGARYSGPPSLTLRRSTHRFAALLSATRPPLRER
jgi:hypothetical protein